MSFAKAGRVATKTALSFKTIKASQFAKSQLFAATARKFVSQSGQTKLAFKAAAAAAPFVATSAALGVKGEASVEAPGLSCTSVVAAHGIAKPASFLLSRQSQSSKPDPSQQSFIDDHGVERVAQAGEDAFFVSEDGLAFGVADGVGGWSGVAGADSAAYSKNLMQHALDAYESTRSTSHLHQPPAPVQLLDAAYNVAHQQQQLLGSSTACIATFDPTESKLHYANLGDSGFLLVRHSALIMDTMTDEIVREHSVRAKECQHSFNCPYQLGSSSSDRPSDSQQESLSVHKGDLLVMATDGFFDNLSNKEIIDKCRKFIVANKIASSLNGNWLKSLAESLALEAYEAASSPTRDTPFAKYCKKFGKRFAGGKMDDITVIVAQFNSESAPSETASASGAKAVRSSKL